MRPHAKILALVLVAVPLIGQAQILTRPLSGRQLEEFNRCMKEADKDAEKIRACVRASEQGEPLPAPTPQPATPTPEPVPPPTPVEPQTPPVTEPTQPTPEPTPEPVPEAGQGTTPATTPEAPTDAERDFNSIYGSPDQDYADPNLPTPAALPTMYDPWERYNRQMHRFNNAVDRGVARPVGGGDVKDLPRPFRLGVSNFFNNLGQPVSAVNALLQGKPKQAAQSLGRFLVNSTLGIAGIFDPASDAKLPNKNEDFGQTLGTWGWKRSRYVELPLFGPRTLRDTFGMAVDAPMAPMRHIDEDRVRIPLQGLQLVDVRAQLLATDSLREGAEDDYALVRDAWLQRRDYQIFGDRMKDDNEALPDYLRDDTNPQVPVDAMPVMPTDGG